MVFMITEEAFLQCVASVFNLPIEDLSLDTSYGSIPEWDSIMHLRLVMEAEMTFGVQLPIDVIPEIFTLRDLLDALNGNLE